MSHASKSRAQRLSAPPGLPRLSFSRHCAHAFHRARVNAKAASAAARAAAAAAANPELATCPSKPVTGAAAGDASGATPLERSCGEHNQRASVSSFGVGEYSRRESHGGEYGRRSEAAMEGVALLKRGSDAIKLTRRGKPRLTTFRLSSDELKLT